MDHDFSAEAARAAYEKLLAEGNTKTGAAAKSEKTNRKKLRWEQIRTDQFGVDLFQTSIPFGLEEELYLKSEGSFCAYHICTSLIVSKRSDQYQFEVFSQLHDEESWNENYDSFNRVEITEDIFGNLIEAYYYKNKKVGIITSDESECDVVREFEWYQCPEKDGFRLEGTYTLLYTEKLFFKWLNDDQPKPTIQKFGPGFGSVWFRDSDVVSKVPAK
ncbi:hypothetical protein [Dyadobacter sp. LHD-138]|uniref:hypothetical protein n=1 Tax=Dyadobacter sp. LHD-138 TaxID=3071413 RepID=UPI0027E0DC18|nr:hypothetical protein [Dyadobacter sp. LHD-138]MDQ6476843.1 hypothetical protein [Dyadobacter sp. LHD-138]